jgi:P2-related tail formation protein
MSQSNENILADSIAGIPHLAAFDAMANARLSTVEIESLLVYVIDSVAPSALATLARQFDVEGFRGYGLATTDEQRRGIIKQAIELKRYMGTVWAIKQAMQAVGYTDAVLVEGIDTGDPDTDWARFKIESVLGDTIGVEGTSQTDLAKLVREYKPARSFLEGISYTIAISDVIGAIEDALNITFEAPTMDEDLGYFARFYNGAHTHNGSITYVESLDSLTINIQNA